MVELIASFAAVFVAVLYFAAKKKKSSNPASEELDTIRATEIRKTDDWCPLCKRGMFDFGSSGSVKCDGCAGSGRYSDGTRCRSCAGRGQVRCPMCHGMKHIKR